MGNSGGESNFQDSSSTSAAEVGGSLSELRRLLIAPEQDQLDSLERRLDSEHEQFVRVEQQLDKEKGKLDEIEEKFGTHQGELHALEQRLGAEKEQLAVLEQKLDNKVPTAEEVSQVLPQAIHLRNKQDSKLSFFLTPLIEDGLAASIKKSPEKIVDTIGPQLGKLISKYASTEVRKLTEKISRIIDRSLSPQALKWRLEAYIKGVPYVELFLSRTLRFRVEQVFLIKRDSGILLCDVADKEGPVLSQDAVSGMLTAIQAFVNDSFVKGEKQEELNFINVGNYKVLIEHGPEAILAGVVKGASPPPSLPMLFRDILNEIHRKYKDEFLSFEGDIKIFQLVSDDLERCLVEELREESVPKQRKIPEQRKVPTIWWLAGGTLATLIIFWVVLSYLQPQNLDDQHWTALLERVKSESGVISASLDHSGEGNVLRVLRDSMNPDVVNKLRTMVKKEGMEIKIKQYVAMSSMDIQKMATVLLEPPPMVTLAVENDVLVARGSASHEWVDRFQKSPKLVPGIRQVDDRQLVDEELIEFSNLKSQIEDYQVRFEQGSARLSLNVREELSILSNSIKSIDRLVQRLGKRSSIEVHGYTSSEGSVSRNNKLALARAKTFVTALNLSGLQAVQVIPVAIGTERALTLEDQDKDLSRNRRVTLHVTLLEK